MSEQEFEEFEFGKPLTAYVGGGGGNNILTYMNKAGAQDLDFLQEYEDMLTVAFHWDEAKQVNIPCPGAEHKDKCPGCVKGIKPSTKIITVAHDPKTGYANVWQLPISIKESLQRNSERNGTLRDRPYTLYRSDTGNRVTYELERGDKYDPGAAPQVDEIPSVKDAIKEAWKWATNDEYRKGKKEDQQQQKDSQGKGETVTQRAERSNTEPPPFDEPPTGEIAESEIRGMSYLALVQLATEEGVEFNDDMNKQQLADAIVSKLSV